MNRRVESGIAGGLASGILLLFFALPLAAQEEEAFEPSAPATPVAPAEPVVPPDPSAELALLQGRIADNFDYLEKLMLRMAEFDSAENARRAALLKQAVALSKDRDIDLQLEAVVRMLEDQQLGRAVENQERVHTDLKALLDLLMTEDRPDRIRSEQDRVKEYIKEVERILRMQRTVQGRTEGGVDTQQVEKEQQRVADRTNSLEQRINDSEQNPNDNDTDQSEDGEQQDGQQQDGQQQDGEQQDGEQHDGQQQDGQQQDGQQQDGQQQDGQQQDGQQQDGQQQDGQQQDGQQQDGQQQDGQQQDGQQQDGQQQDGQQQDGQQQDGQQQDGQQQDGQQQDGQQQDGQQQDGQQQDGQQQDGQQQDGQQQDGQQQDGQQQDFPGRKRIQEAEQRMRQAQQKLSEAKRRDALKEQEEARRALEQAKAELEEILRQLREEEIERMLVMLEARFRKMLEMELQVYENTVRLDKIPLDSRDRRVDLEAGKLGFEQRRILTEADRCLTLLEEEGSSIAFPEAVEQMRADMEQVAVRLNQAQIGRITQGLEEEIIETLDEMVAALQQAQEDQEERQQQQQQQQQQQMNPEDQALVDRIAELKLLKSMQLRINKRTARYSQLLDDEEDPVGQAQDEELVKAIQDLSLREQRVHEITRDIVLELQK